MRWFDTIKKYTEELVAIRSLSPGSGEIDAAHKVVQLLCADGMESHYTAYGLDAIANDPHGRQNAYAFIRGKSPKTIVLLGHFDIVGTADYGRLEPLALNPAALNEHLNSDKSLRAANGLSLLLGSSHQYENLSDWMFGRGVADMKSGVAINIELIRRLAREAHEGRFPLSVLMLATADEEYENVGVVQAVQLLTRLREQYNLDYLGVINTDYTTELYPGDPHRYIYAGTIGKLLPCFFCVGAESHVGFPFLGFDVNLLAAELIRNLSMNDDLCDSVDGQLTAPPVTLRYTDTKLLYNVQLPFTAYFYLNVLTLTTSPGALLERLRSISADTLTRLLSRIDAAEERWRLAAGEQPNVTPRSGSVLTYAELYSETAQKLGAQRLQDEMYSAAQNLPANLDKREHSFHLVQHLWTLSGRSGPAVVIYYAPPYCPHVAPAPGALYNAVSAVVEAHPEEQLVIRSYFPYIADMSYLCLDEGLDVETLQANMPNWQAADEAPRPGAYSLPFEAIRQLNLPVIDWGIYGRGAHQRHESVYMPYSFETLPQLLYETIQRLARSEQ